MIFNTILINAKNRYKNNSNTNYKISYSNYKIYLNKVYGKLSEILPTITPDIIDEINYLENTVFDFNLYGLPNISTEYDLLKLYSNLSFCMAREAYFNDKSFKIAKPLLEIINNLYNSDLSTSKEKKLFLHELSETILDFLYASGDTNICSIRLSHILK